jgi:hypothetical protein
MMNKSRFIDVAIWEGPSGNRSSGLAAESFFVVPAEFRDFFPDRLPAFEAI